MAGLIAMGMAVVSEKTGHQVVPCGPNVCLTPAAPSPLPIPYPVIGSSSKLNLKCDRIDTEGGKGVHASHCKIDKVKGNEAGSAATKDITVAGVNMGLGWALPVPAVTIQFEGKPVNVTGNPGFSNSR